MLSLGVVALLLGNVLGDMYLHYPRGSNNRLNEKAAARNNGNRLFDSQNNNRGGYNVGDMDPVNGFDADSPYATFTEMYDFRFLNTANDLQRQYEEIFFENSIISATWTNQHGTGNKKLNSQMILQFICDTFPRVNNAGTGGIGPSGTTGVTATMAQMRKHGLRVELYNGGNTGTPSATNDVNAIVTTYSGNNSNKRGRRESEEWYYLCQRRARNDGLFHSDQNLNGDAQKYTRQNPNGDRRGLECPEERDYYPYWNPTPFHDIAIITPDVAYCEDYIAPESQNVKEKYGCVRPGVTASTSGITAIMPATTYIDYNLNGTECTQMGGSWESFKWNGAEPECVESYWTKVNYLGNIDGSKRGGKQAGYDWKLPSVDYLTDNHYCYRYTQTIDPVSVGNGGVAGDTSQSIECVRMMFRIRYNMSTMDYDPYKTNSSQDESKSKGIIPPIENNPQVDVGVLAQGLQLAINSAQTGRTFQDNSHTFLVCERPTGAAWQSRNLLNINVRGKRGNIVQTFPATEYDFEPQQAYFAPGDCMHFQWTGSNTHNNGNPAGDGQAGDAGEGRGGSDRSNLVQARSMQESYPLVYDQTGFTGTDEDFFSNIVNCYHPLKSGITVSAEDAQIILGSAGFYRSVAQAQNRVETEGEDGILDVLLNNVSASFRQGLICCVKTTVASLVETYTNAKPNEVGKPYSFLSTRNNNFTNRSQKWKVIIVSSSDNIPDTKYW